MKKYKTLRKKIRPHHLIMYKCPYCGEGMKARLILGQPYQWWFCDKCKKRFELSFREIIKVKNGGR